MNIQSVKKRFDIIGNSNKFNQVLEIALQVAPTDLSILITGESGVGKETIPKIIHAYSSRKHNKYVAVNCGAIPEGTMDSELFGHVKGSFTGAIESRKGYFEEAHEGTIFLDEVAEMSMQTQTKLLRVLETGEFMKIGSSKTEKVNTRIIAATNVNILEAIKQGKFREDLYYRLNSVPINAPSLQERKEDIYLLFRKFASDFSEKYRVPAIRLKEDAINFITNYHWAGNIRQLKNFTKQLSILEEKRELSSQDLSKYLQQTQQNLPVLFQEKNKKDLTEKKFLYKILFKMKKDIQDLKKIVVELMKSENKNIKEKNQDVIQRFFNDVDIETNDIKEKNQNLFLNNYNEYKAPTETPIEEENIQNENLSLEYNEKNLIIKALKKNTGKKKYAALDLGISERTLYRKIKEFNIKEFEK